MIDIILLLIFNTFVCVGVYIASQWDDSDSFDHINDEMRYNGQTAHKIYPRFEIDNPMVLWWIRYYASYLPKFWQKPIYRCLPCMASVWSVPVLLTAVLIGVLSIGQAVLIAPTYILALAGINYFLSSKI
jgi:hypothetical protein